MSQVHDRGAELLTLSPQLPDFSRLWAEEDGIEFPVLSDLGNGVARTYGLTFRLPDDLVAAYRDHMKIDLLRFNGDDSWELAIPATYVVAPSGEVAYVSADADYTRRPEPEDLLVALDGL
ncbi:MAG: redoxin domain-containing protein [Gemmatimonadetes bacterium]|nr:redoxin domain-containing protein [Gemmatimonadota bacterium]